MPTHETLAMMTDAQLRDYMDTHPQRDRAYLRVIEDVCGVDALPEREPEDGERWDGQE